MIDAQAERLRARVAAAGIAPAVAAQHPVASPRLARTVAVASGKGGVGKSTVALGIAMAAAERGVRTALVDADLGMANLDLLCGVRPERTVADWLGGRAQLTQCFVTVAPRLWLLPGASGMSRMADLMPAQRARLVEGLARVSQHVQLLVIDLGAGIGAGTLDIACAADRLLLVATPEPTSLADAYGFAKACVRNGRRGGWACAATMAGGADDGERALARLTDTARRHLGIEMDRVGIVEHDPSVPKAVRARVPLLAHSPSAAAAHSIRAIEARLAGQDEQASPAGGFLASLAARMGMQFGQSAAAAAAGIAALGGIVTR